MRTLMFETPGKIWDKYKNVQRLIDTYLWLEMEMKLRQLFLNEILELVHAKSQFSPARCNDS